MRIIEAALFTLDQEKIHIHFSVFLSMLYQKSPPTYEAVTSAKNISDITGFNSIVAINPGNGYRTNGHNGGNVNVSTKKVASFYLEKVSKQFRELEELERDANSLRFPENLLLSFFPPDQQCNMNDYPSIGAYINIVRHAGGFGRAA